MSRSDIEDIKNILSVLRRNEPSVINESVTGPNSDVEDDIKEKDICEFVLNVVAYDFANLARKGVKLTENQINTLSKAEARRYGISDIMIKAYLDNLGILKELEGGQQIPFGRKGLKPENQSAEDNEPNVFIPDHLKPKLKKAAEIYVSLRDWNPRFNKDIQAQMAAEDGDVDLDMLIKYLKDTGLYDYKPKP